LNSFTPLEQPVDSASNVLKYISRLKERLSNDPQKSDLFSRRLNKAAMRYGRIIESNLNLKDSREFYRYVNSRVKGNTPVGVLQVDSVSCSTSSAKASALASHFALVFVGEPLQE